jgi:molecular chaperone DnaJ
MTTAALGGEIDAPTLDGGKTRVKVPAGVQSGKQLRLRGKGMPALRGAGAGDLYIELAVETPVNLSHRQRELLKEFEEAGRDNSPETQDFFSRVKGFWEGMKG